MDKHLTSHGVRDNDGHMTTMNIPSADNIVKVFRSASPEQMTEGLAWYADAHSLALALDPENPTRAAGVISALSPLKEWNQNKTLAIRAYADGAASGHMSHHVTCANRILAGEPVERVLKGDKTRNFAAVIADPTDPRAVVVDRHAFDIAVGMVTDDATRKVLVRKGMYEIFANEYRRAAKILGYSPAQVQAVTWVVWRETATQFAAANRRAAGR